MRSDSVVIIPTYNEKENIEKAIKDYKEICNIKVKDEGKYYKLILSDPKADKELIWREFENYLIGIGGVHGY